MQLYAKTLLGTVHYLTVGRHPSFGMILGINDYGDNSFWLGDGLITAAPVAPAFSLDEDNVGVPVAQHLIPEDLCSDHGKFLSESDTVVTLGEPEPLSEDTLDYLFVCPPDPPKIRRGSLRNGIRNNSKFNFVCQKEEKERERGRDIFCCLLTGLIRLSSLDVSEM